ncbi:hypothetical protein L5M11_03955 [Shewanella sp. SM87]|uniref:hypothetical protein n=1 Tax=Shewanella sp. SM87 TaxID=2912808 RepID=UPI0021D8562D|nr:hypothetical protein [Shewanella sp. SM87]MCU8006686.1 hypothetical protein [Shewanella sp. SM87]
MLVGHDFQLLDYLVALFKPYMVNNHRFNQLNIGWLDIDVIIEKGFIRFSDKGFIRFSDKGRNFIKAAVFGLL